MQRRPKRASVSEARFAAVIAVLPPFAEFIPKRYNKYITRVSTVLIVTQGLLLMTKGLKLL